MPSDVTSKGTILQSCVRDRERAKTEEDSEKRRRPSMCKKKRQGQKPLSKRGRDGTDAGDVRKAKQGK
jgi:hypothetical protein